MSLLTYQEARPWARSIKAKVTAREMPPWHIDRNVGIAKFKDDPSLSDAEIATIASWVDGGAPQGNPADLPAPRQFGELDSWYIGKPDLVVTMERPYVLPADGPDNIIDVLVDPHFTEDMYVMAIESKPADARSFKVVHHFTTYLVEEKVIKRERGKASVRAKVEHPFRVIKRQFGLLKVRFRGLAKNTAHVVTLFALSNLWMARKQLMAMTGVVRPKAE